MKNFRSSVAGRLRSNNSREPPDTPERRKVTSLVLSRRRPPPRERRSERRELGAYIRCMERVLGKVRKRIVAEGGGGGLNSSRGTPRASPYYYSPAVGEDGTSDRDERRPGASSTTASIVPFDSGEEEELLGLMSRATELVLEIERREGDDGGGDGGEDFGRPGPYPSLLGAQGSGSSAHLSFSEDDGNGETDSSASFQSPRDSLRLVSLLCDVLTGVAFADDCVENSGMLQLTHAPPIAVAHYALRSLSDMLRTGLCRKDFLFNLVANENLQRLVDLRVERYWYFEGMTRGEIQKDTSNVAEKRASGIEVEAEELMSAFVSFLKNLAKHVRLDTVRFYTPTISRKTTGFYTTAPILDMREAERVESPGRIASFPLFDRALGLCCPDRKVTTDHVRLSALHICLDIVRQAAYASSASKSNGEADIMDARLAAVSRYVSDSRLLCQRLVSPVTSRLVGLCNKLEESILAMDAMRHRSWGCSVGFQREDPVEKADKDSSPLAEIQTKYLDAAIKTAKDMEIELTMLDDLLQIGDSVTTRQIIDTVQSSFLQKVIGKLNPETWVSTTGQVEHNPARATLLPLIQSIIQERPAGCTRSLWFESFCAVLSSTPEDVPVSSIGADQGLGSPKAPADGSDARLDGFCAKGISQASQSPPNGSAVLSRGSSFDLKERSTPLSRTKAALISLTAIFSNITNKTLLRHLFSALFNPLVPDANEYVAYIESASEESREEANDLCTDQGWIEEESCSRSVSVAGTPLIPKDDTSSEEECKWRASLANILNPDASQEQSGAAPNPTQHSIGMCLDNKEMIGFATIAVRAAVSSLYDDISEVVDLQGRANVACGQSSDNTDGADSQGDISQEAAQSSGEGTRDTSGSTAAEDNLTRITNLASSLVDASRCKSLAKNSNASELDNMHTHLQRVEEELLCIASIISCSEQPEMRTRNLVATVSGSLGSSPAQSSEDHNQISELRRKLKLREEQLQSRMAEEERLRSELALREKQLQLNTSLGEKLQSELALREQQLRSKTAEEEKLRSERVLLQEQLESRVTEEEKLQEQLQAVHDCLGYVTGASMEKSADLITFGTTLKKTNDECLKESEALRLSMEQSKASITQLESDRSHLSSIVQSIEEQLRSKTEEAISLRQELQEVQEYLGEMMADTAQTQEELNEFTCRWKKSSDEQHLENKGLKKESRVLARRIEELESENADLRISNESKEKELATRADEIHQLTTRVKDVQEPGFEQTPPFGLNCSPRSITDIPPTEKVLQIQNGTSDVLALQDELVKSEARASELESQLQDKTNSEKMLNKSLKKAVKLLKKLQEHVETVEQEKTDLINKDHLKSS